MFRISKEIQFDAGHRVPLHESKCRNPHGHRYRVVAHLYGDLIIGGPEAGMVKDFSNVKEVLTRQVHDVYDHGFIVSERDEPMITALSYGQSDWKVITVPFYPTAECLARAIYFSCGKFLPNLIQIDVWETPTSMASYSGGDSHYVED